jgi:ketol-acid reductoisomerase
MAEILAEIQDGTFAKEWILENQAGRPVHNALKRMAREDYIEEVGEDLRDMMPWLKEGK